VRGEGSGWTYAKAGVDEGKVSKALSGVWKMLIETFDFRKGRKAHPLNVIGHYAGLLDVGTDVLLALHVDGVGSKVLVAQMLNKYDTVGIDLVAMHANDLISIGAEPVALVDYLAVKEPDEQLIQEVMKGVVEGAKIARMCVIGGETAVLPDVITGYESGKPFDLSGMSLGVVERDKVILGDKVEVGDAVIGLASSGIHSNGLTLARRVLFEEAKIPPSAYIEELRKTLGEELLTPTRIYVDEVLSILESGIEVHGLAHITGGAFTKLKRISRGRVRIRLDKMPEPQPIFKMIQRLGNVETEEMYRTFNMGIGFVIVAPRREIENISSVLEEKRTTYYVLGRVESGSDIVIRAYDGTLIVF